MSTCIESCISIILLVIVAVIWLDSIIEEWAERAAVSIAASQEKGK